MLDRYTRRYMGAELGFGIVKLGALCVYPCPNMLAVVCCGIPRVGAKPSMVVRP
jgi:hypothetical protein